ncbi:MAG TPA: hypothetical protein VNO21_21615, partial [Polyangiaceae bacterium]|nr:hypothetical protein [Polyangiaceae bacterium]
MKAWAWPAMLGLALGGCGYTDVHEVVFRPPSAPTHGEVQVYMGQQAPPSAFYEVALLQAMGHDGEANVEDVTQALRERARTLGCDALVRVRFQQGYTMTHAYGVCVKWTTPETKPPAPMPLP